MPMENGFTNKLEPVIVIVAAVKILALRTKLSTVFIIIEKNL